MDAAAVCTACTNKLSEALALERAVKTDAAAALSRTLLPAAAAASCGGVDGGVNSARDDSVVNSVTAAGSFYVAVADPLRSGTVEASLSSSSAAAAAAAAPDAATADKASLLAEARDEVARMFPALAAAHARIVVWRFAADAAAVIPSLNRASSLAVPASPALQPSDAASPLYVLETALSDANAQQRFSAASELEVLISLLHKLVDERATAAAAELPEGCSEDEAAAAAHLAWRPFADEVLASLLRNAESALSAPSVVAAAFRAALDAGCEWMACMRCSGAPELEGGGRVSCSSGARSARALAAAGLPDSAVVSPAALSVRPLVIARVELADGAYHKCWHERCLACAVCRRALVPSDAPTPMAAHEAAAVGADGRGIALPELCCVTSSGELVCSCHFDSATGSSVVSAPPASPAAGASGAADTDAAAVAAQPVCHGCGLAVEDECLTALGASWHVGHFCCRECALPLDPGVEFVTAGGEPFCFPDYEQLFLPPCVRCRLPIRTSFVTALDQQWHHQCFSCTDCREVFGAGGSYFEWQGAPFCEKDFQRRAYEPCAACHLPISKQFFSAFDKKYHRSCFVCGVCGCEFPDGAFMALAGAPYCAAHVSGVEEASRGAAGAPAASSAS